jgi:hypothetical protein
MPIDSLQHISSILQLFFSQCGRIHCFIFGQSFTTFGCFDFLDRFNGVKMKDLQLFISPRFSSSKCKFHRPSFLFLRSFSRFLTPLALIMQYDWPGIGHHSQFAIVPF